MNNIDTLKFWSQKILPLVYDDSLSYYEVISKIASKLNEVIGNVNELPESITSEVTKQLSSDELATKIMAGLVNAIATDEGNSPFTASNKSGGELIWLNGTLYKVVSVMQAGTNYIVGTNIMPVDISEELRDIKEKYLASNNEHWNNRSENNYNTGVYLYWKDVLYVTTKDIKTNDILYNSGDNQNLKQVTLTKEITDHYNEMHDSDLNLQTQIDGNDGDIETLQNSLTTEVNRATTRENSIDSRISNIVAQSGNDNTEITDARQDFFGTIRTTLHDTMVINNQRAVGSSNQILINATNKAELGYTDFNDLPINQICGVYNSADLDNSPSKSYPNNTTNLYLVITFATGYPINKNYVFTQFAIGYDDTNEIVFVRSKHGNTWTNWTSLGGADNIQSFTNNQDLDTATPNTTVHTSNNSKAPTTENWEIMTFSSYKGEPNGAGRIQIAINTPYVSVRQSYNNTWSAWNTLNIMGIVSSSNYPIINNANKNQYNLTSLNDLPINKTFVISGPDVLTDTPPLTDDWSLIVQTYGFSTAVPYGYTQVCTAYNSTNETKQFVRTKHSTIWTSWVETSNDILTNAWTVFKRVGICGDSLSTGYALDTNNNDGTHLRRNIPYTWGKTLQRESGNEFLILGQSGYTIPLFLQSSEGYGLNYAKQLGKCDAYIICLGVNDNTSNPGTLADVPDDLSGDTIPEKYIGQYAKLIYELKQISPTAKIFCMTMPTGNNAAIMNQSIRELVNSKKTITQNCFVIDLAKDEYKQYYDDPKLTNTAKWGHYTCIGYALMAKIISKCWNDTIIEHYNDFWDVPLIDYKDKPDPNNGDQEPPRQ